MSAPVASRYVHKLVKAERDHAPDEDAALEAIARRTKVGKWTLHNLKRGRAKTVDASIFERIRTAYLDWCERQLAALQHEIAIAREATPDAHFLDLDDEVARLRARLADARGAAPRSGDRGGAAASNSSHLTGAGSSSSLHARR